MYEARAHSIVDGNGGAETKEKGHGALKNSA
jgi:hypothetical protein